MEKNILNFHFDYLNSSLTIRTEQRGQWQFELFIPSSVCLNVILEYIHDRSFIYNFLTFFWNPQRMNVHFKWEVVYAVHFLTQMIT